MYILILELGESVSAQLWQVSSVLTFRTFLLAFYPPTAIVLHHLDNVLKWKLTACLKFLKLLLVLLHPLNAKMTAAFTVPSKGLWQDQSWILSFKLHSDWHTLWYAKKLHRLRGQSSRAFISCLFGFRLPSSGSCFLRTQCLEDILFCLLKVFNRALTVNGAGTTRSCFGWLS